MDLWSILLGAALATGGGLIAQRLEQHFRRQREDRLVLLEVNDCVLELNAVFRRSGYPGGTSTTTQAQNEVPSRREAVSLLDQLSRLALRLQQGEHRGLAVRATKVALQARFQTEAELYTLTRAVQLKVNGKMITKYEAETARQGA